MDDHFDKEGPLAAIDRLKEEITQACNVEDSNFLSTLTRLGVITEEEQEDAFSDEEYETVIDKLKGKIKDNPNFFTEFCTAIQRKPDLQDLAEKIIGEWYKLLRSSIELVQSLSWMCMLQTRQLI